MERFRDSVAVVTGAASGLGRALSEELGRRGAVVLVSDLDEAGARAVAEGISAAGGRAFAAALDVRDAEAVQKLITETAAAHGRLDYVFNNAGLAVSGEVRDLGLEHWHKVLDVNLWGVIHGVHAAYPLMVEQRSGHIVNIASLAGLVGFPSSIPYVASKSAVVGLSLSLRTEGEALGVKVTAVCPGFVQTAIFDSGTYVRSQMKDVVRLVPFKMMPAPAAAEAILRGVSRNQAVIVFPFYARFLWWLTRIHSSLASPIHRKAIGGFRKRRREAV
jgi:NAD(P)-dependent dehydrogenase (short-subunit alcohol dehydrogenase family)